MRPKVEIGDRYGLLVVIEPLGTYGHGKWWLVRCDCGTNIVAPGDRMLRRNTRSCGRLKRQRSAFYSFLPVQNGGAEK